MSNKLLRSFFLRGFEKANLLCLSEKQLEETLAFYKRMSSLSKANIFMKNERLKLLLAEFLIFVNDLYLSKNMRDLPDDYNDYGVVYQSILYVQENFSSDISRKTLATVTGIRERVLCEKFKRITGMTTNQYILNFRLAVAKKLLLKGIQAATVSEQAGFDNYSNFSRTFKKHVGLSPKQYAMKFSDRTNSLGTL
jgi:AraC-like DNA-binding protein